MRYFRFEKLPLSTIFLIVIYFSIIVLAIDWVYGGTTDSVPSTGDSIYIESLYRDLFTRHFSISGWLVSRAPYFFPDWIAYFIIRMISGNYGTAWVLYLIFDLSCLLLIFYGFVRLFSNKTRCEALLYSVCWGTILIFLLKFGPPGYGPHTLLLPVYHSGALINGLLIFWVWNHHLSNPLTHKQLIFFTLFCAIATLSDEWWMIWFGIPIGVTTVLLIAAKKLTYRRQFIFLIAMSIGVIIGELITRLIDSQKWLYFSHIPLGSPSASVITKLREFIHDLVILFGSSPLLLIVFIMCIGLCIKTIISSIHVSKTDKETNFVAMHIAILLSFIIPIIFIVTLKMWGEGNYRYLHPFIFLPWLVVGLHLLHWQPFRTYRIDKVLPLFLVPVLFYSPDYSFRRVVRLMTRVPYQLACVDSVARSQQLHNGLSEYPQAKTITETSHAGLFVNQMTYVFDVYHWMNNLNWYYDSEHKKEYRNYDFIVTSISQPSWVEALKLFGEPSAINVCGQTVLLIYKDDKNKHFNEIIQTRVARFFNRLEGASIRGKNILQDKNDDLVSSESWSHVPVQPDSSSVEKKLFDSNANPTHENVSYYSRWEIKKPTSYGYLEKHFSNVNSVLGKQLVLVFWARSLTGEKEFSSHMYLEPNGILDNTAVFVGPKSGSPFTLSSEWKKITVFYTIPGTNVRKLTNNSFTSIRPVFFENASKAMSVDIANVQLIEEGDADMTGTKEKQIYIEMTPQSVTQLIANVDRNHAKGNYNEEYKLLKKAEVAILANLGFSQNFKSSNSDFIKSELLWRLARVHYQFAKTVTPEERVSHVYVANEAAEDAYRLAVNVNTQKWVAILALEVGAILGTKQMNNSAVTFSNMIHQALIANPNNPELYALLGKWNYDWAEVGFITKLKSKLLSSPLPRGSYAEAEHYFSRAHELDRSNILYQYWQEQALKKLHHNSLKS